MLAGVPIAGGHQTACIAATSGGSWICRRTVARFRCGLNNPATRARARERLIIVEFRGFRRARSPQEMFRECSDSAHRLHSKKPRHRRQRCASRRAPMGAVEERVHRGAGSGASTDVLRDWRPAPRDRRGVGRLPSRSTLIWRTTRSRAGGAGAIETPTPGAVPGCCPGRWALAHHRDTRSYMAAFIPQWNGIGLCIGTSA